MPVKNPVKSEALIHRALADPSRASIIDALRRDPEPLDAQALAQTVGLHVNTVRSHLRQLEDAGLVRARRDAQGKPGRPHIVFESTSSSSPITDRSTAYQLLAEVLARSIARGSTGASTAAEAAAHSAARGYYEDAGDAGDSRRAVPRRRRLDRAMRMLSRLGFDPVVEAHANNDEIVMRSCPFDGLSAESLEIACSVHRGLIRGALDDATSADRASVVDLYPEPGRCVARVATSR